MNTHPRWRHIRRAAWSPQKSTASSPQNSARTCSHPSLKPTRTKKRESKKKSVSSTNTLRDIVPSFPTTDSRWKVSFPFTDRFWRTFSDEFLTLFFAGEVSEPRASVRSRAIHRTFPNPANPINPENPASDNSRPLITFRCRPAFCLSSSHFFIEKTTKRREPLHLQKVSVSVHVV